MSTEKSTLERVQDLMVDKLSLERAKLGGDAILKDLGVDSLAVVEFIFHVEDEFKISVPDAQMKIETVQDIAMMVDKLKAEQSAA